MSTVVPTGRHPYEQKALPGLLEELVDRLPRPLPPAVVVDDEHAAGHESWIEMLELVAGGLVPVGVQAEDRDRARI